MKKKLRFVLLALAAVVGAHGYAANLKKPALKDILKYQALNSGDTVFIYNVGQKKFLAGGEAWGTQAIVSDYGYPAVLTKVESGDFAGTYTIWSEVPGKDENSRYAFRTATDGTVGSGVKAVFVDNNLTLGARAYWAVNPLGNNLYTIGIPDTDPFKKGSVSYDYVNGEVLGVQYDHPSEWAADPSNTPDGVTYGIYYDVVYDLNEDNCTWAFVPASIVKAHNLKDELEKVILQAEEYGIEVNFAVTVYNSKTSSYQQVAGAISKLKDDIASKITPDRPIDRTDLIVNPGFDEGSKGWQITSTELRLDGGDGTYNDDKLIKNGGGLYTNEGGLVDKIHQVLNVKPGVYKFGLNVALAAAHENSYDNPDQFVYAETSYGIAQKTRTDSVIGHYEVFAFVGEDGKLEIGFNEINPVCTHFVVDNATLTYYGNQQSSFIYASEVLGQEISAYEELDDDGFHNYTTSYRTAIDNAVASAKKKTKAADAVTAFKSVVKAYNDFKYSYDLYARAKVAYVEANYYDSQLELDLGDFIDKLEGVISGGKGTNVEVAKLLDDIQADEVDYIKKNIKPNTEYPFLVNNTFTNGSTNGWNLSGGISAFKGGQTGVIESWDTNGGWDMNQVLTGVRPGVWKFEVWGYFRPDGTGETRNYWTAAKGENKGKNETRSKISINGKAGPFPAWISKGIPAEEYEELSTNGVLEDLKALPGRSAEWGFWQTGVVTDFETNVEESRYYPDRLGSAAAYFDIPGHERDYISSVSWIVGEDGKVDLHIFNDDYNGEQGPEWTVIKEVHLYYEGNELATLKDVLKELIDKADEVLKNKFEKKEKDALKKANDAAKELWKKPNTTAGLADQISVAYGNLVKALELETVEAYKALIAELETTKGVREQYRATSTKAAGSAADKLIKEVETGINNGSYSKEQTVEKIAELQAAAFDLKKPKDKGSDDDPQDWTFMIRNPKYQEGVAGWTVGDGGKVEVHDEYDNGVAEIWNNNGTISQVVKNLPVGTYKVSVQGFYRQGVIEGHVNTFLKELAEKNKKKAVADSLAKFDLLPISVMGVFYGNESGVEPRTIIYQPEGDDIALFQSASGSESEWYQVSQIVLDPSKYGVTWYMPVGLTGAAERFSKGMYDNYFYAQVVDDSDDDPEDGFGTLELGLRTFWHHEGDWFPFTNWRLEYYGEDSKHAKEVNDFGATNSVERVNGKAEVISTEYFSIDGSKRSSLQCGLNIVKVKTADGKTVVRKVLKK